MGREYPGLPLGLPGSIVSGHNIYCQVARILFYKTSVKCFPFLTVLSWQLINKLH